MTSGATPPMIRAEGVTRTFGDHAAVRDLTFAVPEGAILGLIGPSGSGKSTTVRILAGTLARSSGELSVMGEDPSHFTRRARTRMAYMPQLTSVAPDLSAAENVGFVAALYGLGPFRRARAIRSALEVVELWPDRHRLARDLSGGMQRRLELACALVHSPRVLFVDEPTAGLDPILRQAVWAELRRLREDGCTLLVTTQHVAEAEECDAVALITDGELIAVDEPANLRRLAFGGELLELEARRAIDSDVLAGVDGVLNVRQPAPRRLVIVAADAASATPKIMDALSGQSIDVLRLAEYRPSFDETFEVLVERRRSERATSDEGDVVDGGAAS